MKNDSNMTFTYSQIDIYLLTI